jgi:hypothetical protein
MVACAEQLGGHHAGRINRLLRLRHEVTEHGVGKTIMRRVNFALPQPGVICSCATVENMPREIRYLPPTDSPARTSEIRIPRSHRFVWEQLPDHLQQSPPPVERVAQNAGLIVTISKGNPEPYGDCSWIMSYGPRVWTGRAERRLRRPSNAVSSSTDEWWFGCDPQI